MMKKVLLATTAMALAQPLSALPWTVGQQSISYDAAGTADTIMAPNTAPAYAYQLADIPSNFTEANWIHSGAGVGGQYDNTSTNEAKGRFDCQETITANDDPMLAYNVPNGSSHRHHAMGNYQAFTQGYFYNLGYNQLRSAGNSTCYGGPLNRSLYWEPAVEKLLNNGVQVDKRAKTFVTYYIGGLIAAVGNGSIFDPNKVSLWPRGLGMIGGYNMADPGNSKRAGMVTTAGTGYGSAETNTIFTPGFLGWYCGTAASGNGSIATSPSSGTDHQPWLRNGDGTPTLNCASNDVIVEDFVTQNCWDGVNLDSPDERSHVAYAILDNYSTGNAQYKCPKNWAVIPRLEVKSEFAENGQSDYTNWWLSSDRMPGMNAASSTASFSGTTMTLTGPVTGAYSAWHAITGTNIPANTMIVSGSGTTWTLNHSVGTISSEAIVSPFNYGETGHFDFRPAWAEGTAASPGPFLKHMVHCEGLTVTQASTGGSTATLTGDPHECDYGRIDSTEQLFVDEASPDGSAPNPIVNLGPNQAGKLGYFPVGAGTPITGMVHNSH